MVEGKPHSKYDSIGKNRNNIENIGYIEGIYPSQQHNDGDGEGS
jgi:hypothetical protein